MNTDTVCTRSREDSRDPVYYTDEEALALRPPAIPGNKCYTDEELLEIRRRGENVAVSPNLYYAWRGVDTQPEKDPGVKAAKPQATPSYRRVMTPRERAVKWIASREAGRKVTKLTELPQAVQDAIHTIKINSLLKAVSDRLVKEVL